MYASAVDVFHYSVEVRAPSIPAARRVHCIGELPRAHNRSTQLLGICNYYYVYKLGTSYDLTRNTARYHCTSYYYNTRRPEGFPLKWELVRAVLIRSKTNFYLDPRSGLIVQPFVSTFLIKEQLLLLNTFFGFCEKY